MGYGTEPDPGGVENTLMAECRDETPGQPVNTLARQNANPLPVIPRCQEGLYSCWATSTEMILEFLGGYRVRQCDQANEAFGQYACCGGNDVLIVNPYCDWPWHPEFGKWGYTATHSPAVTPPTAAGANAPPEISALDWSNVTDEINAGRPFAFSWIPTAAGTQPTANPAATQSMRISHMMVLIGYSVDANGQQMVTYLNPGPFRKTDAEIVPFTYYKGTAGYFSHREDYWEIKPKTSP